MSSTPVAAAGGAGVSASEGVPVVPPASSPPVLPGATDVPDWVVQHAPGAVSGTTKPIPFVRGPLEGGTNCWCEQDASVFALRSASYLEDSVKTPSRPPPFRAVGVNCYKTNKPLHHAAAAMAELREYLAANSTHFFTIVCWLLPGSPSHCVVNLFIRTDGPDPVFDGLFKRFVEGTDEFRNSRFKFICKLVHAPWLVSTAVSNLGGERPAILGKKLTVDYHRGANYIEIDVDVGSSKIASMVNGVILRSTASMVVDLGFLLEGQAEDELPERMLSCVRFQYCEFAALGVDRTTKP